MIKYDFDEIIDRKNNHSVKYNELKRFNIDNGKIPEDFIPLWIADMDFKTAKPVIDALQKKVKHGIYGYVYRPDEYFESFINWQKRRFDWNIQKELLSFSIGVVPSLGTLIKLFSDEGDKILIQPPVYSEFYDITEDNKRIVIENKFKEENGVFSFDLIDFEEKLKQNPKLFIFCNPHNPLGHVWTFEELKSIGDLCVKYNVPVISDEIHADLTLWGKKHIPMASVSEKIRQNTITCTSTGKAFNLAGMQSATIIFNNIQIKNKFDKFWKDLEVHRNNPFNLVATIAAYSDEGEEYLNQLISYLEKNILYVHNFIKENSIKDNIQLLSTNIPEATYLIWIDCRNLCKKYNFNQEQLEDFFIKKARLGLNSCRAFMHGSSGFMRLNAACPRPVLEKALNQLKDAINSL